MANPLDAATLEALIRNRPDDVDRAFIEVGPAGRRIGLAELSPAFGASYTDDPATFAQRAVAHLTAFGLLDKVSAILAAEDMDAELAAQRANMSIDEKVGAWIFGRGLTARCGIYRGLNFVGSGCIVGPSLVLTSTHVLGPPNPSGGYDSISVKLYNNESIGVEQKPVVCSLPAPADSVLPMATQDTDFADDNDVALLRTKMPVGSDPFFVELPTTAWRPTANASLTLYHFPLGANKGVGACTLTSFTAPALRWTYISPAQPGSSGGACLNASGKLVGVHQGKRNTHAPHSRLVPLSATVRRNGASHPLQDEIAREVAADIWPSYIWSLDGRMDGDVVIGRTDLFRAFAHLGRPDAAYRALWIRREDPTAGTDGLGYSVQLVRALVDRQPRRNRMMVLAWPQAGVAQLDPVDHFAAQLRDAGLVGESAGNEAVGIATGETGSATVLRGRVEALLAEVQRSAEQVDEIVWLVIEHAGAGVDKEPLAAAMTLAGLVPRRSRLRVILTGNETQSPFEDEVRVNAVGDNPNADHALVEYIGPIRRADVAEFIRNVRRLRDGVTEMDDALVNHEVDRVLQGLPTTGARYPLAHMPEITARLRSRLG
jgi:hypothetical protein